MSAAVRSFGYAMLVAMGLAGCTPAAFVQRAQAPQACEVRVCTINGATSRCDCKTVEQMMRQTRHGFWPHAD